MQRVVKNIKETTKVLCGKFNLTPYQAHLLMYREVRGDTANLAHLIFPKEEREAPDFFANVGAPGQWPAIADAPREAVEVARNFSRSLPLTNLRSWEDLALCDSLIKQLKEYPEGALGENFLKQSKIKGTPTELMAAKRALLDVVACKEAMSSIYTKEECFHPDLLPIMESDDLVESGFCTEEFYLKSQAKAIKFASEELAHYNNGASFVGVTMGWKAPDHSWHLFGNLVDVQIARGTLSSIPKLFGASCFELSKKVIPSLYNTTYLCVVAADILFKPVPSAYATTMLYTVPASSILSCVWMGTLPAVIGPYDKHKRAILTSYNYMKKELK